jgi:hypothetical protein
MGAGSIPLLLHKNRLKPVSKAIFNLIHQVLYISGGFESATATG